MADTKKDIYVYADWQGMDEPKLIGILSALLAKGKKAFSGYVQANRKLQRNTEAFFIIRYHIVALYFLETLYIINDL